MDQAFYGNYTQAGHNLVIWHDIFMVCVPVGRHASPFVVKHLSTLGAEIRAFCRGLEHASNTKSGRVHGLLVLSIGPPIKSN